MSILIIYNIMQYPFSLPWTCCWAGGGGGGGWGQYCCQAGLELDWFPGGGGGPWLDAGDGLESK